MTEVISARRREGAGERFEKNLSTKLCDRNVEHRYIMGSLIHSYISCQCVDREEIGGGRWRSEKRASGGSGGGGAPPDP